MKACTQCRFIIKENDIKCPRCGANDLTEHFGGILIVINADKSEVAKQAGLNAPGEYALYFK